MSKNKRHTPATQADAHKANGGKVGAVIDVSATEAGEVIPALDPVVALIRNKYPADRELKSHTVDVGKKFVIDATTSKGRIDALKRLNTLDIQIGNVFKGTYFYLLCLEMGEQKVHEFIDKIIPLNDGTVRNAEIREWLKKGIENKVKGADYETLTKAEKHDIDEGIRYGMRRRMRDGLVSIAIDRRKQLPEYAPKKKKNEGGDATGDDNTGSSDEGKRSKPLAYFSKLYAELSDSERVTVDAILDGLDDSDTEGRRRIVAALVARVFLYEETWNTEHAK